MKKKFLAFLLAALMVVSLLPTVAFADTPTTVAGFLATVEGFPEGSANPLTIPENAWVDGNGNKVFKNTLNNTNGLFFVSATQGTWPITGSNTLTQLEDGNYKYIAPSGSSVVLVMNEGQLVSINANNGEYTGTYEPPKGDDDTPKWKRIATGVAITAGITAATVGTIHTVKAIKNYKAEKAAAAEAAKLAEMPMVAMGSSGDAVTTLQTELNAQGYNCGEVDGIFGQNTLNAVIAFQTAKGLTADGVVGELTWTELL